MNIIDDIAEYLEDQSIGTVGTDIIMSNVLDTPDNIVVVRDTGGAKPDAYIPTGVPDFQIYVRNKRYATGKALIDSIAELLHRVANTTLIAGGKYFYYIVMATEVLPIGRDDKGRSEFSVNFNTKVKRE